MIELRSTEMYCRHQPIRTSTRSSSRFQNRSDPLIWLYLPPQPKETIASELESCYPVTMTHYFEDRLQRQWRPRLLPSQALLPHELVNAANEIGRIYTNLIGKPARTLRIVVEDDDESTPEMRFEPGPSGEGRPGRD